MLSTLPPAHPHPHCATLFFRTSDINLIPQTLDAERTGAMDLNTGLGNLPVFKSFKKSEYVYRIHKQSSAKLGIHQSASAIIF